jgi:hypothetical protein
MRHNPEVRIRRASLICITDEVAGGISAPASCRDVVDSPLSQTVSTPRQRPAPPAAVEARSTLPCRAW